MKRLLVGMCGVLLAGAMLGEFPGCAARGDVACGVAVRDSLAATDCEFSDSTGIFKDHVQTWRFRAQAGEIVRFHLSETFPLSAPWLGVYDDATNTLLESRHGQEAVSLFDDGTVALDFTAPYDGTFLIAVSTFDGLDFVGRYTLAMTCNDGPPPQSECPSGRHPRALPPREPVLP